MIYPYFKIKLSFVWLILLTNGLTGCAVGIITVNAPETSVQQNPIFIDRDVYFDVCVPSDQDTALERAHTKWIWTSTIKEVLQRDFGVRAHEEAPATDKPYFHFLVTPIKDKHKTGLNNLSFTISLLSFSVIPGYAVDQRKIDIQFATMDWDGAIIQDNYTYEYQIRYFLWLPLIFYPDILMGINGGYENTNKKNYLGLVRVIDRFILDATDKLHRQSKDANIVGTSRILKCPAQ
jgi:hypothetical protein